MSDPSPHPQSQLTPDDPPADVDTAIAEAYRLLAEEAGYTTLCAAADRLLHMRHLADTPQIALLVATLRRKAGEWQAATNILVEAAERFDWDMGLLYEGALSAIDANEYGTAGRMLDRLAERLDVLDDRHRQGIWRGASLCGKHELAHRAFIGRADSGFGNPGLRQRIETALANEAEMRRLGVDLISIGDNCLPWMLGNRWGLRAEPTDPARTNLFNLAQCAPDTPLRIIAAGAEGFVDPARMRIVITPHGSPMAVHESGFQFNHEQGALWMADEFERLRARYAPLVTKFKAALAGGRRIFFHYAEQHGADLNALVDAIAAQAGDGSYRILIVDPKPAGIAPDPRPELTYRRQALPNEEYVWFKPDHYDADEGIAFEQAIAGFVLDEARLIG